ncbi:Histone methylation protein, partial [Phytophthora megakarya]
IVDQVPAPLPQDDAVVAAGLIFRDITRGDVRQKAGKTQDNAGEVLSWGVVRLIQAMSPVTNNDIFLDVGAGVGNILAQVAIATSVRACVDIEVRSDLCQLAERCLHRFVGRFPHLGKVVIKKTDVRDVSFSSNPATRDATLVFANFFLFEEDAKLVLARELATLSKARLLAVTLRFCPRHRKSCTKAFCLRWKLADEIFVSCSWMADRVPVYLYSTNAK